MINVRYETRYDGETVPRICKVVSNGDSSKDEEIVTNLTLSNLDEIEHISDEELWEHMQNMVEYMKVKSSEMTLVEPSSYPDEGWPAIGWATLFNLNEELTQWWVYVTRRENDGNLQVIHYH